MQRLKTIAITHKNIELNDIGKLHLDGQEQERVLSSLKVNFGLEELMYLSTCNRVEFILKTETTLSTSFLEEFFAFFNPSFDSGLINRLASSAQVYEGHAALKHLFMVASSIDSLVVGEREIITQVRKAYEKCLELGLTGDLIRLVVKQTIETAKEVYTHTDIAKNPVSVVSLAYRKLRELGIKNDARFIIIGAGETNTTMAKYLRKHQYANFAIFNRTVSKAEMLAAELQGTAYALGELKNYIKGFDVIITCTGASEPIITKELYTALLAGEKSKKVVIDLAVPNDLAKEVSEQFDMTLIAVNNLNDIAKENLRQRESELDKCESLIDKKMEDFEVLLKERKVELAFSHIRKKLKEIRETGLNEGFVKELNTLDEGGKEVLDKILAYMEKKYNAVAMKTAKEVFLNE